MSADMEVLAETEAADRVMAESTVNQREAPAMQVHHRTAAPQEAAREADPWIHQELKSAARALMKATAMEIYPSN
jgi:hypothetical protein